MEWEERTRKEEVESVTHEGPWDGDEDERKKKGREKGKKG